MAHLDRENRERKALQKAKEQVKVREILASHNKKKAKIKSTKKKTADEMWDLIEDRFLVPSKYVRDPLEWKPNSYNLQRQVNHFLYWIYCLYPVPSYFFELFQVETRRIPAYKPRPTERQLLMQSIYFDWFLTIGQGGSFAKVAKEIFSKKEAHLFLIAPTYNSIEDNIWWAKCRNLGIDVGLEQAIISRIFKGIHVEDDFWWSLLLLIKRDEPDIDPQSLSDIMDFLKAKHFNDRKFSLKGRTYGSLIKLSNDWHRDQQIVKLGGQNLYWPGVPVDDWEWTDKQQKITWKITQLHTSKELMTEGRRMKHCVASYSQRCVQGATGIFSMTANDGLNGDEKEVTIEINSYRQIVQARARWNKSPSPLAQKAINRFVWDRNLTINKYSWW